MTDVGEINKAEDFIDIKTLSGAFSDYQLGLYQSVIDKISSVLLRLENRYGRDQTPSGGIIDCIEPDTTIYLIKAIDDLHQVMEYRNSLYLGHCTILLNEVVRGIKKANESNTSSWNCCSRKRSRSIDTSTTQDSEDEHDEIIRRKIPRLRDTKSPSPTPRTEQSPLFKCETSGDGYWSSKKGEVDIIKIEFNPMYNELKLIFKEGTDKGCWDTFKYGLIYTDTKFLSGVHNWAKNNDIPNYESIEYTEQGMQGDDYVSLETNNVATKEALNRLINMINGQVSPKQKQFQSRETGVAPNAPSAHESHKPDEQSQSHKPESKLGDNVSPIAPSAKSKSKSKSKSQPESKPHSHKSKPEAESKPEP